MKLTIAERMAVLETDIKYIKEHVSDNKTRGNTIADKVDKVQEDIHNIALELKSLRSDHTVIHTGSLSSVVMGGLMVIKIYLKGKFGGIL